MDQPERWCVGMANFVVSRFIVAQVQPTAIQFNYKNEAGMFMDYFMKYGKAQRFHFFHIFRSDNQATVLRFRYYNKNYVLLVRWEKT